MSVVFLSATFLRPKINLGGNQNEKLSPLPPAVSVKQTSSKTL